MVLVQVVALLLVANTAYGHILLPNLSTICKDNKFTSQWYYYPHPTDCHKYISCENGLKVMDCHNKTAWNFNIQECDQQAKVPACSGWTGGYYYYHHKNHHHYIHSPNPDTVCKKLSLSEGYHPHPTDCGKFIQCIAQTTYFLDCPAGLKYNIKKKACGDVNNVDCYNNHDYFANIIFG